MSSAPKLLWCRKKRPPSTDCRHRFLRAQAVVVQKKEGPDQRISFLFELLFYYAAGTSLSPHMLAPVFTICLLRRGSHDAMNINILQNYFETNQVCSSRSRLFKFCLKTMLVAYETTLVDSKSTPMALKKPFHQKT